MRKSALITRLLVAVMVLLPVNAAVAANWSGNVKVTSIEVSNVNAAGVWLSFSSDPYNGNHTCSAKSGQYMLGGGVDNVNKMTSVATDALVYSRNVAVFWGGNCSGGGTTGYPVLVGVWLK